MNAVTLLQQFLINSSSDFPDKNALIIGKKKYTYQYLLTNAVIFSHCLKEKGFKRGDRVVLHAGNSIYTVIAFWGTLMADGIVSVIASDLSEEKICYILNDASASVYVAEKISPSLVISLKECLALSQIHFVTDFSNETSPFFENIQREIEYKPSRNNELDLASIIYTSGSTGEPKGVMLTHRNMLTATFSINQYLKHNHDDVILSALPMSFDYGLYQMILAFSVGATLVLEPDAIFPTTILKKIETEKVSILPCVPTLFSLLAEHGRRFKFNYSSLRAVTNTGSALTQKHIKQIQETFPKAEIFSMYGLTECKRCTYLPPHAINHKPDSVGIAIPNTELWIVDDAGKTVGSGVIGQLVIRGATVMKGYWNRPDETAMKLKDGPIYGEKVLYTGDYALLDEEGYLYFKGRMDEVIKFKGIKVSPIEIETIINRFSTVKETAVLGIEEENDNLKLIICVVPSDANVFNHDDIKEQIRNALSKFQQPSYIYLIKKMPKNTNGKIDKKTLKADLNKLCLPRSDISKSLEIKMDQ